MNIYIDNYYFPLTNTSALVEMFMANSKEVQSHYVFWIVDSTLAQTYLIRAYALD